MERQLFDVSGYSEEQRLSLTRDMLTSSIVDNHRNLDIIETTPFAQNYPADESLRKMLLVYQANEYLPEIKPIVLEVVAEVLHLPEKEPKNIEELMANLRVSPNPGETTRNSLYVIETLLKSPHTFAFPEKQYRLATAHVGTLLAAKLYKSEADEEVKSVWLSHVHYFAAFECLYSGIRTNSTLFAVYPEQADMGLVDELLSLVSLADEKEAQLAHTRSIFEGHSVSPIQDLSGRKYFYMGRPRE